MKRGQVGVLYVHESPYALHNVGERFSARAPYYRFIPARSTDEALDKLEGADILVAHTSKNIQSEELLARTREYSMMPALFRIDTPEDIPRLSKEPLTAYGLEHNSDDQVIEFLHHMHNNALPHRPTVSSIGNTQQPWCGHDVFTVPDEDAIVRLLNNKRLDKIVREDQPYTISSYKGFSGAFPFINASAPETDENPSIYLIAGERAAGKDSLVRNVVNALPYTKLAERVLTRKPRPLELTGPITFTTEADVYEHEDDYAEIARRGTYLSAVRWNSIENILNNNQNPIIIFSEPSHVLDLQKNLKSRYPDTRTHIVLVTAPYGERVERARQRGGAPAKNESQRYVEILPDEIIHNFNPKENFAPEKNKPFLPSREVLDKMLMRTREFVQYIQNT